MKDKTSLVSAEVEVEIPFHDVDSAMVAWHGHYTKYLELARCALLDKIDYNYQKMCESGYFWPVIDLHIRYVHSTKFQQRVRVEANLIEWENRLTINYLITDAATGQRLTKARTTQVAVRMDNGEMQLASPAILLQKLNINE